MAFSAGLVCNSSLVFPGHQSPVTYEVSLTTVVTTAQLTLCPLAEAMGGGGGWHDAMVCFDLQLAAPIGRSPHTALPLDPFPPSAVAPIGLSSPCVLPLPPWRQLQRTGAFIPTKNGRIESGSCASTENGSPVVKIPGYGSVKQSILLRKWCEPAPLLWGPGHGRLANPSY